MAGKHVVVTGGAGFIGANLCRAMAADDQFDRVVALDDLSTGCAANLDGIDCELVEGSILDDALLDKVLVDTDSVVHLAARPSVPRSLEDPMASHTVNATGTLTVLEAMRRHRVGHIVVASSSSVYGATAALPKHEELATRPLSPYGASKLAAESYALAHGHSFGINVLALRFFNVFGPLQTAGHAYAAVVPAFITAALEGRPLPIHGDGNQTRDFTYVGTVCAVLADAVARSVTSVDPVNLAFGTRTSLLEFIEVLEGVIGHPLEREHQPPRGGDVRDSQAENTRLRALFPEITAMPLPRTVALTVDWYRGQRR
ncbi:MAG: NAD-dependent epimerase/dehydratase family protein [Acidimicrobiales bacterium]